MTFYQHPLNIYKDYSYNREPNKLAINSSKQKPYGPYFLTTIHNNFNYTHTRTHINTRTLKNLSEKSKL